MTDYGRMTVWRPPDYDEVERVFEALQSAFAEAQPHLSEDDFRDISDLGRPRPGTRARALWEPLRLAWCAHARFRRAKLKARMPKALTVPVDDDRRDRAIQSVERALALLQNAAEELQEDAETIHKFVVMLEQDQTRQRYEDAKNVAGLADETREQLSKLKRYKGIRQIYTQREWDEFISDAAEGLLRAGFSSREVAGLLSGSAPEDVDRATLERFRQRVRRRRETQT